MNVELDDAISWTYCGKTGVDSHAYLNVLQLFFLSMDIVDSINRLIRQELHSVEAAQSINAVSHGFCSGHLVVVDFRTSNRYEVDWDSTTLLPILLVVHATRSKDRPGSNRCVTLHVLYEGGQQLSTNSVCRDSSPVLHSSYSCWSKFPQSGSYRSASPGALASQRPMAPISHTLKAHVPF